MSRVLPILFNTDMVRAILDGLKGATRRLGSWKIAKLNVDRNGTVTATVFKETKRGKKVSHFAGGTINEFIKEFSDYQPGDILYVRETWCDDRPFTHDDTPGQYFYRADSMYPRNGDSVFLNVKWKPSIHMPKEAVRIWLKVKDVRVERLQEITDEEAEKEGCNDYTSTVLGFCYLWDSTIKKSDLDRYGWDASPWVWVIEFERCEEPG